MLDFDFEYDGVCLSDLGYIICSFDDKTESVLDGSQITFNQTSIMMGKHHLLANANYEECLKTEFDICKSDCMGNQENLYITSYEEQEIRRWLNRKSFHKFRFLSERFEDTYFIGSFNVQTKEFCGNVIGFHLSFVSDSPFGYTNVIYKFDITEDKNTYTIYDLSDEEGDNYIDVFITCKSSGDLEIKNLFNNKKTIIKNCSDGEEISISNLIIESSLDSHEQNIMNDFNFIFPQISNTFLERKNTFMFSLPCSVTFKYKELRKIGI